MNAYRIYENNGHTRATVADVDTIEAARVFLAGFGELVCFEIDPDGHDAADAALVRKGGGLSTYSIEAN